jgi:hypothetical protein
MTLRNIGVTPNGYWTMGPDGQARWVRVKQVRRWDEYGEVYVEDGEFVNGGYNPFSNDRIRG